MKITQNLFVCRKCGACCRQPGFVRLENSEGAEIAAFLGIAENEFADAFTALSSDRRALVLKDKNNGECVMLDAEGACRINSVKPRQCREFPFSWRNEDSAAICPAMCEK